MKPPKVVKEGILNIGADLTVRVALLDNGNRVIYEEDFFKVLEWLNGRDGQDEYLRSKLWEMIDQKLLEK